MSDHWLQSLRHLDTMLDEAEVAFANGRQHEHALILRDTQTAFHHDGGPWREALHQCWVGFLQVVTEGSPDVALGYCHKACAIAQRTDLEELRAFMDCCKAQIHLIAGDLLAGQLAGIRALAAFEARGNIRWACRTLWLLSALTNAMMMWLSSLAYCERALTHARAITDTRLTLVGLWRTGSTLILSGAPAEGVLWCDAALAHAPAPFDRVTIDAVRGHGLIRSGHLDEGIAQLEEATAWFKAHILWHDYSVFGLHLGEGYVQRGESVLAQTLFEDIVSVSQSKGYGRLEKKATASLHGMQKEQDHVDPWQ